MKNILFLLLIGTIISCNNNTVDNPVSEDITRDLNKSIELANIYIESLVDMKYDTLPFLLKPKAIFYGPSINDSTDFAGNLVYWKSMREWFDTEVNLNFYSKYAIYDEKTNSDWVFIRGTVEGHHLEYEKDIKVYIFADFRIKDNKVAQINVCWDGLDLLTQLGYIFKAPS